MSWSNLSYLPDNPIAAIVSARVLSFRTAPSARAASVSPMTAFVMLLTVIVSSVLANEAKSSAREVMSSAIFAPSSRVMPKPTSKFCWSARYVLMAFLFRPMASAKFPAHWSTSSLIPSKTTSNLFSISSTSDAACTQSCANAESFWTEKTTAIVPRTFDAKFFKSCTLFSAVSLLFSSTLNPSATRISRIVIFQPPSAFPPLFRAQCQAPFRKARTASRPRRACRRFAVRTWTPDAP